MKSAWPVFFSSFTKEAWLQICDNLKKIANFKQLELIKRCEKEKNNIILYSLASTPLRLI